MNKTRLVWGIVCLVLAVLLGVLNLVLPADSIHFNLGKANLPWFPPAALGVVGIVLLVLASEPRAQSAEPQPPAQTAQEIKNPEKAALNKRYESVAWGCFLIMLGGFALIPGETIPKGFWSIGLGLIMLGLNQPATSSRSA